MLLSFKNHLNYLYFKVVILTLFSFVFCTSVNAQDAALSNYKVFFGTGDFANKKILIIRSYQQLRKDFYIGIDLNEIKTCIIPANQIKVTPTNWKAILNDYKNTPYIKAIEVAKLQSFGIQNSGISHGYPKEKGITLTIDLCPSHKPLDRVIFNSLINEFKKIELPVPIALSITGRFMINHSDDIEWLKSLETSGDICITWINHSFNHHFNPKIALKDNFLLEPGTDINFEVLGTEIALLEKGLLFSAFFRFPGLVSNNQLIEQITNFGLIPIGSDAWLAKGQPANNGNIVLIHGNGNEPIGVKDFILLLQKKRKSVINKQWLLYDLRESVEEEFESNK